MQGTGCDVGFVPGSDGRPRMLAWFPEAGDGDDYAFLRGEAKRVGSLNLKYLVAMRGTGGDVGFVP